MSKKKSIIIGAVVGLVILSGVSSINGSDATAGVEPTSKPAVAVAPEPTSKPAVEPDLEGIKVHFVVSSGQAGPIFKAMSESANELDLDGVGDGGQRLVDWADDEREWLRSTEFPECVSDQVTRWTKIVDTFHETGELSVKAADDFDIDALTEAGELLADGTDQLGELTELLPSIWAGC